MQLQAKEAELIRRLLFIENSQERMAALMDRAKRTGRGLEAFEKTEENRVQGCVSRVWLVVTIEAGKCNVRFDAESAMVKALVGLICELYQGAEPAEVLRFNPVLLEQLGFHRELTPTRLNGLQQVIGQLKSRVEEINSQLSN